MDGNSKKKKKKKTFITTILNISTKALKAFPLSISKAMGYLFTPTSPPTSIHASAILQRKLHFSPLFYYKFFTED